MQLTDFIGIVLIAVVIAGSLRVIMGRKGPSPDRVNSPWARRFLSGTFLQGLLSAVALGSAVQGATNSWATGLTVGGAVGVLFGLLSGTGDWKVVAINFLALSFGAVGIIVTIGSYFSPLASCAPADLGQRVLSFILVTAALAIGAATAWSRGFLTLKKLGPIVLATFGALGIAEFVSSPLGVPLVQLGLSGWLVALVVAVAVGFAGSIWPEFVITFASITVAAGIVYGSINGSATALCAPTQDLSALAPIIGYTALFIGIQSLAGAGLKPKAKSGGAS